MISAFIFDLDPFHRSTIKVMYISTAEMVTDGKHYYIATHGIETNMPAFDWCIYI